VSCHWCCKVRNRIAVFFGFKRTLCGKWTVDSAVELEAMYGLDVETELVDALTNEITKEIELNGSHTWKELCEREEKECK